MKTQILKTTFIGIFALVTISSSAFAGTKEATTKTKEDKLIEQVVKSDLELFQSLEPVATETNVYVYDVKGNLVFEAKLKDSQSRKAKRIINKSDFLAEVNGSQYFILSAL